MFVCSGSDREVSSSLLTRDLAATSMFVVKSFESKRVAARELLTVHIP